jgi:mannonate dehydratase
MDRRTFVATAGATVVGLSGAARGAEAQAPKAEAQAPKRPLKMHVGCQRSPTNAQMLQNFKRHGVNHICGYPPNPGATGTWSEEDVARTKDLCEQHGITLEMVTLPLLASTSIDRVQRPAIMLGKDPERDRDIESIQKMIAVCAKVGVPAFKYNMNLLGVPRTRSTPGRGGTSLSTWRLQDAQNPQPTKAGTVDADLFWERITYFLDRIIPVCNEYKVRAACHPHDPGVPTGYKGVDCVLGRPEGLRRFLTIQPSPYHGLNLCLGTLAEMLADPGREIYAWIREFGQQGKIFNIHFRNIRGHRDEFQEVFPDEGDVNMVQAARVLQEVGYEYMLMPDHMPRHPDDPGQHQAFAYGYGYIKGILQTLETLG